MLSNTERGKAFQIACCEALRNQFGRDFDFEVSLQCEGKAHSFNLATSEKDIVVECKAFSFTQSGNNPSAKITTLREAISFRGQSKGMSREFWFLSTPADPIRGETLGKYFVRLNSHLLGNVLVMEMAESGGEQKGASLRDSMHLGSRLLRLEGISVDC
jgi:hypothetical protein